MVLIMYRERGNGGIQGIVLDCFYMDRDGKIANEFYIVTDSEEGELKKIEDDSIKKIDNPFEVQRVFAQYFLTPKQVEIASNT